jgi:hypothetical protein
MVQQSNCFASGAPGSFKFTWTALARCECYLGNFLGTQGSTADSLEYMW